jgi:dTDP-4-dehydrorhamnose reductase
MLLPQAQRERDRVEFASGLFNLAAAGQTSRRGWAEAIAGARNQLDQRVTGVIHPLVEGAPVVRPGHDQTSAARPSNSLLCSELMARAYGCLLGAWEPAFLLSMSK